MPKRQFHLKSTDAPINLIYQRADRLCIIYHNITAIIILYNFLVLKQSSYVLLLNHFHPMKQKDKYSVLSLRDFTVFPKLIFSVVLHVSVPCHDQEIHN